MGGRGKKSAKGTHQKPKRVPKVACIETSGKQLISDPWTGLRSPLGGKLSPAEEWKRLQDTSRGREVVLRGDAAITALQASTAEEWRIATTNAHTQDPAGESDVDADDEAAKKAPNDDNRPVERLTFGDVRLSAKIVNVPVSARDLLTTGLVSIDLSGTRLDDAGLDSVVAWTPWLRELSAAGNTITRVPHLSNMGKLQSLDLGRNAITSLPADCFPGELGSTLRKLNLEDNRLDRLDVPTAGIATEKGGATTDGESTPGQQQRPQHQQRPPASPLHLLTSLIDLNVARNKLDGYSVCYSLGIFTKAGFPRLSILDVRGNNLPAEEESQELLRISTVLPTLKTLNGGDVSRTAMTFSSKQPMFELLSTGDQDHQDERAEDGRREESCSCTEGNPCAVSYNCRDWANRFEIAAAAAATPAYSAGSGNNT